jgi:hypothetical protein
VHRPTDYGYAEAFSRYADRLAVGVKNLGECGVLAMGEVYKCDVVIDDATARRVAKEKGVQATATVLRGLWGVAHSNSAPKALRAEHHWVREFFGERSVSGTAIVRLFSQVTRHFAEISGYTGGALGACGSLCVPRR